MPEFEEAHIEEIDVELQLEPDELDEGVLDPNDTHTEGVDNEA